MTVRMDDYHEFDYAADKRGWLTMQKWGEHRTRSGIFRHTMGDMEIYQQEVKPHTRISITFEGRNYSRVWKRDWTDNTLSRLCRQFAADLEAKQ